MFLNNRHYDPTTGTFISVDPLVTKTMQPYIYGAANPVTYSDPSGLDPDTASWVRERQRQGEQILPSVADDPSEFGSRLLMGLDQRPGSEAEWWLPTVGGELACVGQWACQRAYEHLLDHPYDVTGAQIYAATYCGCADGYVTSELIKTAGDFLLVVGMGAQLRAEARAAAAMEARGRGRGGLANSSQATIDPAKLTEYALNPRHPVGGNKARVIESKFGYNRSNALDLIPQIREGVMTNSATLGRVDVHGVRYSVDIAISGPGGSGVLRTAWIYDPGSPAPRLVSLYVP